MDSCPSKEKGPKCFKCSSFRHRAAQCNNDSKENDDKKVMCLNENKRAEKPIKVNDKRMDALIDTGSDINAMRRSIFKKTNISELKCAPRYFKGAGGAKISVTGYFSAEVWIDDQIFYTRMYIVNDSDIPMDVVIGNELLFTVNLTMKQGKITIEKIENDPEKIESDIEKEEKQLMCMAIIGNEDDVPVAVKEMIENYAPKIPKKESVVELKIQMVDEIPVHQTPRRLPHHHKQIVDKQISEWIENGIVEPGTSPYACNVVVTKKKDNSDRVCI